MLVIRVNLFIAGIVLTKMAHIKRLVMHGFKSFAKRTEIPFDKGINVIIGPNGSGKSNISDAICFVLGRLSAKSMRAEKSRSLIFMGSKYVKPGKEAYVEIVFDNSDRVFSIDDDEVVIKRGIRAKGGSIYKINGETKTRTEIIETLAQAGIDPYGFNLILQGQIQSIVKMHGEERRKIIEEVAGISVYEWRKEKSLKELDKTDERLKEISTVLRERTAFLNNLEREKAQAQKYKGLQIIVRRARASITKRKLDEKSKEMESFVKAIEKDMIQKDKKQVDIETIQEESDKTGSKINEINQHIRRATGLEQGMLREEITNLRAELEGLRVRKEGQEHRRDEIERRVEEMKGSIPGLEDEIKELKKESPLVARKAEDLNKKKAELEELEKERKEVLAVRSEISSMRDLLEEKKRQLARANAESGETVRQMEKASENLKYESRESVVRDLENLKENKDNNEKKIGELIKKELENEKMISVSENEIGRNREVKKKVSDIDVCPLCQSKMTKNHVEHVFKDAEERVEKAEEGKARAEKGLEQIRRKRSELEKELKRLADGIRICESNIVKLESLDEKRVLLKKSMSFENLLKKEISEMENKRKTLEEKSNRQNNVEEKYRDKLLEIEEISSRTLEDLDTTLLYKARELEKIKSVVKGSEEGFDELVEQVDDLGEDIENKQGKLDEKERQEEKLNEKFKKMYNERDDLQKRIQDLNLKLNSVQNEMRQIEDQINYLKVGRAKLDGERQTLEMDMSEYVGVELLQGTLAILDERLRKAQNALDNIGSINMRALEVYDEVKKEYDIVKEKVEILNNEKEQIMKIIEEIDKKKKKSFMKTFKAINTLFSENYTKLSSKGKAYLEIENREDIFSGGVDIIVRFARGKYFDVHSLSGGEQTLVALSLLFSIQKYRPYHFYILDEVDAALDKRNSERLAVLLNQYMKSGQYIVVTHNDAIILDSQVLYGISMHEGVSKVLSLKVK